MDEKVVLVMPNLENVSREISMPTRVEFKVWQVSHGVEANHKEFFPVGGFSSTSLEPVRIVGLRFRTISLFSFRFRLFNQSGRCERVSHFSPKLERNEQQEQTLAGRNSYAKTDPDTTVFRTKDGEVLPAYNLLNRQRLSHHGKTVPIMTFSKNLLDNLGMRELLRHF